jgi:hypothetical protein
MSAAYDPNKQGWGFASVVVLLTGGLLFTAYSIHERTYIHPRDPMAVQVFHERDAAKGSENHSEAKAEPGAEAKAEGKVEGAAAPAAEKH